MFSHYYLPTLALQGIEREFEGIGLIVSLPHVSLLIGGYSRKFDFKLHVAQARRFDTF